VKQANHPKPRKATLSVQYVVRKKDEVDELKKRFDEFTKLCTVFDYSPQGDVPVVLSLDSDGSLSVNLDPSCEIAFHDMTSVVGVVYNVGYTKFCFKGNKAVKVRIAVMGPPDGD
jgi:hypothetical protein